MRFRIKRVLIVILFLLWIGVMVAFFKNASVNYTKNKRGNSIYKKTLDSFDWRSYVKHSGLRPGEDKNHRNAYNQAASDALDWDRVVPDVRDRGCQRKTYTEELPATSVIICYHNEGRAALLRTIVSVLNRSPEHLIEEIILVDDYSNDPTDGIELLKLPKVKLIRNYQREGLIRSRVKGADMARGAVLTFLDSHCECNTQWLEPLLQSIKDNPKVVVSPVIDVINHDDFRYLSSSSDLRGGFGWNLNFKWDFLPPKALREHKNDGTAHIKSPAIAGGLFSIQKKWFEELGKYDPEMDVWGGENLEISFRTWQCGGEMHIVPCSRVGHVFRDHHPYKFPGGSMRVFQKNTRRAAEVWMDDYKKHYFAAVPSARNAAYGDIRARTHLRKTLNCKSFKWFLENVYPELRVPDEEDVKYGQLKQGRSCLDTLNHNQGQGPGTYQCHNQGGNQHWSYTKHQQLKHETVCLSPMDHESGSVVQMVPCDKENAMQKWNYMENGGTMFNMATRLCLDAGLVVGKEVVQKTCSNTRSQKWIFHII